MHTERTDLVATNIDNLEYLAGIFGISKECLLFLIDRTESNTSLPSNIVNPRGS